MRRSFSAAVPLAAALLSSIAVGQFQPNHSGARFTIDRHAGSGTEPVLAVRGPCQSASMGFYSRPDLVGQPMAILLSTGPLRASGAGAFSTAHGQMVNLDLASTIALPAVYGGGFDGRIQLETPGGLSTQFVVLDPAMPDGFAVSGPGRFESDPDTVIATRPEIFGVEGGQVVQADQDGNRSPLSLEEATPVGLALDGAGNLYFGRIRSLGGFHVELFRRDAAGLETSLGIVVDTRNGFTSLGISGFDLVWLGDRLVFNHPSVFGGNVQPGSLREIDPTTGVVTELTTVAGNPSGLAVDAQGNLYYGVAVGQPARLELFRRDPQGVTTPLGTAFDTAGSSYAIGVWAVDLAVFGSILAFNEPAQNTSTGFVAGRVGALDLDSGAISTLVGGRGQPSGLTFDAQGGLYFTDVGYSPSRATMHYRDPVTNTVQDLGLLFTCGVGLVPIGPWGIDLLVPCAD